MILLEEALLVIIPLAILTLIALGIYFLPTLLAWRSNSKNFKNIFLLNLFFGWTFIVWVFCLAIS